MFKYLMYIFGPSGTICACLRMFEYVKYPDIILSLVSSQTVLYVVVTVCHYLKSYKPNSNMELCLYHFR